MTFAKALQRALAQQGETVEIPETQACETHPEEIPMMYRAQISGRCSLQFAGSQKDRDRWTEELLYPEPRESKPRHQHSEEVRMVLEEGRFCRLKISFPWRVFTNCGQDSIARPVLDVRGIPHIPGSSIKGLFRRECEQRDRLKPESGLTNRYCGDKNKLKPGIAPLRFHGAYPVGDWAGTIEEETQNAGEPRYRMVDVVHPQEDWQIGKPTRNGQPPRRKNASALISLYQPTLVFEISSSRTLSQEEWKAISGILKTALRRGLGGKTSSGYGLAYQPKNQYDLGAYLMGRGTNPVLLGKDPEFRPNLFKAALRGHTRRLLAGCSSQVDRLVGELFGSTKAPARVEIFWDEKLPSQPTSTYDVKGTLWISAPEKKEKELLQSVFQFAYTMGGFGKSWRRVWHEKFYQPIYQENNPERRYDKDIGCHWESDEDWLNEIQTPEQLTKFLNRVEKVCQRYCGGNTSQPMDWREAWHQDRVAVYAAVTQRSQAIELFHNPTFKMTPAIGGKKRVQKRNGIWTTEFLVSSVWHRMLPISDNRYLEIVTVFHGDRSQWYSNNDSQLQPFTNDLVRNNMTRVWGNLQP